MIEIVTQLDQGITPYYLQLVCNIFELNLTKNNKKKKRKKSREGIWIKFIFENHLVVNWKIKKKKKKNLQN